METKKKLHNYIQDYWLLQNNRAAKRKMIIYKWLLENIYKNMFIAVGTNIYKKKTKNTIKTRHERVGCVTVQKKRFKTFDVFQQIYSAM